jgi:hypothetical protein
MIQADSRDDIRDAWENFHRGKELKAIMMMLVVIVEVLWAVVDAIRSRPHV